MTTITNWNKDKQIQKILLKTLNETNINFNNLNNKLAQFVLDSSYNPIFIATSWKLYKYLYETVNYTQNLFWITCGNTAGYFKYNGHIPWDDDIDIGFRITNNFDEYIAFLMECISKGLIVNLHFKKDKKSNLKWYDNDMIINLIHDNVPNPNWKFIKETDFRNIINANSTHFYFASITIDQIPWRKIANKHGFSGTYMWDSESIVTPWIDIIPYIKKDNILVPHSDLKMTSPNLSINLEYYTFLTVPGKFPVDLLQGLLIQYNENRSYLNFLNWDTIFSHIKNDKIIMKYEVNQELHKFIRAFITRYNHSLVDYMNMIDYNEFFSFN